MAKRCRDCRHWQCDHPEQYTWGHCRRYPPTSENYIAARPAQYGGGVEVTIGSKQEPFWVQTNEHHWCGEFHQSAESLIVKSK